MERLHPVPEVWRGELLPIIARPQLTQRSKAATTWEEQQKMDALRKVYHRAVQIPLENVEALWRDLDGFETGLNKITVTLLH